MIMVYTTFRLVGFHNFIDAPEDVAYLRAMHRHEFQFKVSVEVTHSNRHIEFHSLQRECLRIMYSLFNKNTNGEFLFGSMSCEMIALDLLERLPASSGQLVVDVSEDGECGGIASRL